MATSWDHLVAELQGFRNRQEVTKALGKGLRAAVKPARQAIKAAARAMLPHGGGLNVWVSRISILTQIRVSGNRAGVRLKGGRNSAHGRSDIRAIDRGRVRAPTWGHRTAGSWHTVAVAPGFFTDTAANLPDWHEQADQAIDEALQTIRRG